MERRRRALVLGNEVSRHPFRQSLPAHVFDGAVPQAVPIPRRRAITLADWREFLLAYCACFMAVTIFIS